MATTPPTPDQALILHSLPYGDNDLIVTLLGARTGRIKAFAKNGRTGKKRFGSGLMVGAQVELLLNPPAGDSELWRLKEVTFLKQWPWLAPEEECLTVKLAGSYLLDALNSFTQPGVTDSELYQLANLAMAHLHNTPDVVEFLCRFQIRLLLLNGICPDFACCSRCGSPLENNSCWPYGAEIVGPCCRKLLPIDPMEECPQNPRLAILTLLGGKKPAPYTLDLHSLALTRDLLSFHFQKQLKSALLFEKMVNK